MAYNPEDPGGFNIRCSEPDLKGKTIEYWNERSRGYSLHTLLDLHNTEKYEHLINSLIPKGRKADICDMGTASGFAAIVAAKMGHNVVGYDLSPNMVDHARKNAIKNRVDIKFECADVEYLPDAPNSYDLIIAKSIIWCLCDPVSTLRKWFDMLRPGGHILINDGNYYLSNFDVDYAEKQHLSELKDSENKSLHGKTNMDNINFNIIRDLAKGLPVCSMRRPGWDLGILIGLGFDNIYVNIDEKTPYKCTTRSGYMTLPGAFVITARKPLEGSDPLVYRNGFDLEKTSHEGSFDHTTSVFKALSDPNRIKIITCLLVERMNVKAISEKTGISVALVSHNLKILQNADLVMSTKSGKEVYYILKDVSKIQELLYYCRI